MTNSSKWFWLSIALIIVGIVYLLANILTPFILATLFAYLFHPMVNGLVKLKIPRVLAVALLFVIIIFLLTLLILLLFPLLEGQMILLTNKVVVLLTWVQQTVIPWITKYLDVEATFDFSNLQALITENWQQAGGVAGYIVQKISRSSMAFVSFLISALLVPVVAFYLLRDWEKVLLKCRQLLPRDIEPTVVELAKKSDDIVKAFLHGQLLVMFALGILYSFGLWLVGLDLALIIGMISGLISIVPYLGFFVGMVSASIAGFFQFGDWWHLMLIWMVFGVSNGIESTVLTPNLVGDRIGMHPVLVIFAIMAGGQLFGFLGILLALPVTAVLMVLLRYFRQRYLDSPMYQS